MELNFIIILLDENKNNYTKLLLFIVVKSNR